MGAMDKILYGLKALHGNSSRAKPWLVLAALVTFLGVTACSIRTPPAEGPGPNFSTSTSSNQLIDKSFFRYDNGRPKTFLCGWAAQNEVGWISEMTLLHSVPISNDCNIQFDITEDQLIGYQVNPTYPGDFKKSKISLTIPIKHYYYERKKDAQGRDTNEFILNDQRSHYSARPKIMLDLKHMRIKEWDLSLTYSGSTETHQVDEVQWDLSQNFLGFTLTAQDSGFQNLNQGRFRVNFKAFESKSLQKFTPTPYHEDNAKLVNIIHLVGRRANGDKDVIYAAKWDLNEDQHIYLKDFPSEYIPLAQQAIADWNQSLRAVGALKADKKGFILHPDSPSRFAFDLRYPTMSWISERRNADQMPLGIGNALADVQNGEILWGKVTLWGGFIEQYINAHTEAGTGQPASTDFSSYFFAKNFAQNLFQLPSNFVNFSKLSSFTDRFALMQRMSTQATAEMSDFAKQKAQLGTQLKWNQDFHVRPEFLDQAVQKNWPQLTSELNQAQNSLAQNTFLETIMGPLKKFQNQNPTAANKNSALSKEQQMDIQKKQSLMCLDRRFSDVSRGWNSALKSHPELSRSQVLKSVVKELIAHELGHFLGLGHQFKENILPKEGSVPDLYITGGRDSLGREWPNQKARATEEAGYTNYTSVMGYRSPYAEIAGAHNEIKPGRQDELSLAYLYAMKYSTYKAGDRDFTFVDINPNSGRIPLPTGNKSQYDTAYFEQCNDTQASLTMDPYCNRFDQGSTATQIVKGYFAELTDNLEQDTIAFADARGSNPLYREYLIWKRSFDRIGRIRMFYDYMRSKKNFRAIIDSISKDRVAIENFSKVCQNQVGPNNSHPSVQKLISLFAKEPELKELCQANALALKNFTEQLVQLKGPDYTEIDTDNYLAPGNMRFGDLQENYAYLIGSWKRLSLLPYKYVSLMAVSVDTPWLLGWNGITGVPNYDLQQNRFIYSSLYPTEYVQMTSTLLKNNISLGSVTNSKEYKVGMAALMLGYFGRLPQKSPDRPRFNDRLTEAVAFQSRFDVSLGLVVLSAVEKDGSPGYYTSFTGGILDLQTERTTPIDSAYLLPEGKLIAHGENMFILPIGDFNVYSSGQAKDAPVILAMAYKITYSQRSDDQELNSISPKQALHNLHATALKSCLDGTAGLAQFFTSENPNFKGFWIQSGTNSFGKVDDKLQRFNESIQESFASYWAQKGVQREKCDETLTNIGLITGSAALMSGYWLPTLDSSFAQ